MSGFSLAGPGIEQITQEIAARFEAAFPPELDGPRTIGREAEYPVVTSQGQAADVRRLWEPLMAPGDLKPKFEPTSTPGHDFIVALQGEDFSFALEVGVGTIELNTRPCLTLFELQAIQERAMERLARAAARYDWRVLAYGMQPLTPPSLHIMSPKQRYMSLYRAMGKPWLWYTVTASDQVQIDVARPEMVEILNFANLMTPVIIALCGNSPIYGGRPSPFCSAREGEMASIYTQEHRHGMLPRPVRDMADYVAMMAETTYLIVQGDGEIYPSSRPFSAYLEENGADYDAFLFHEHYMWNSARLRTTYATVEIRPACQQPWREHMAVSALGLGLLEAAAAIGAFVREELGENYWADMQEYHALAILHGLRAPQPSADFLPRILDMAYAGLAARGFGEEVLLEPHYDRLARRMNPAQRIRTIFRTDGLRGLINHATIPAMLPSRRIL